MSEQPVPVTKTPVRRAEQDQEVANAITDARQMIETARGDAEIAALLAARGYNAARLAEGQALQEAAQAAFTARQTALAAQKQASAASEGADATARATYVDFREVARAVFTSAADRTALSLNGAIPKDAQKFVTTVRVSYAAALAEPYRAALATYGYPAATIAAAGTTLDALTAALGAQQAAAARAVQATSDREAATKALAAWVRQFGKIAGVALKSKPALARKLGV
jgi:hypothetical protein